MISDDINEPAGAHVVPRDGAQTIYHGASMLDFYAAAALTGLLASEPGLTPQDASQRALQHARAMMLRRERAKP